VSTIQNKKTNPKAQKTRRRVKNAATAAAQSENLLASVTAAGTFGKYQMVLKVQLIRSSYFIAKLNKAFITYLGSDQLKSVEFYQIF